MTDTKGRDGLQREDMRDRLRALGVKARHDPRTLTLQDLDDICTLVATLAPSHVIHPAPEPDAVDGPFEPLAPDTPLLEVQALLRQAHALEYIAVQLGELVKLKQEEVVRARWRAERPDTDRAS